MASAVGSLKVVLTADMGRFASDMGRAAGLTERQSRAMSRSIGNVSRALVGIGTAAAAAFGALVYQQIRVADQIGKMAQRIGVSVESLSTLGFAAQQSGASLEGLETGLVRLARNMADAQRELSTAVDAFNMAGISWENANGTLRDQREVLLEVADLFAGLEDGAEKTAIATMMFGRSGAQLIPMLNQGAAGIEQLEARARELGLELTTGAALAAAEFNDDIEQLQMSVVGLARNFMTDTMPAVQSVIDTMIDAQRESGILAALLVGLGGAAAGLVGLGGVFAPSESLRDLFEQADEARRLLASVRELPEGGRRDVLVAHEAARLREIEDQIVRLQAVQSEAHAEFMREQAAQVEAQRQNTQALQDRMRAQEAYTSTVAEAVAAEEARYASIEGIVTALMRERDTLNMTSQEVALYELANLGASEEVMEMVRAVIAQTAALEGNAAQLETNAALLSKIKDEAIAAGEGATEMAGKMQEATNQAATYAEQAARNIQDSFADFLFDPFDKGLKGMLKGFIDTIRRMIAEAAAAKILGSSGMQSFLGSILGGLGLGAPPPGKALGGPVGANTPYIVGERGPELFVPSTAGSIVPNGSMGGGGVNVHVTVPADRDPAKDIALAEAIAMKVIGATETRMTEGYWPA